MEVTYIGHSGFLVELEHTLLLFDYSEGEIPAMDPDKELYVFASHAHCDHFNVEIFKLGHPRSHYVCSEDIQRVWNVKDFDSHGISGSILEKILFLRPHEKVCLDEIRVETLDSTDEGVAFLVETEGNSILHMGDLHWWVWADEPEEDNHRIEEQWKRELSRLSGRHIDLLFAVLDPRQEGDFWKGLDQLVRTVDADAIYPMHMWGQPELVDRLRGLPCSQSYRDRLPTVDFYQRH